MRVILLILVIALAVDAIRFDGAYSKFVWSLLPFVEEEVAPPT